MADEGTGANPGISRRELVKRGAIVGGTLLWAAPVIQSVSVPAFAASPTAHTCCSCINPNPKPGSINICVVDQSTRLCIGCGRSLPEIAAWSHMSADQRRRIMAELPRRLSRASSAGPTTVGTG